MGRLTETRDGRNVIPLRYGSFEWTLETHCTPECLKERFLSGYPADRLAAYEDTGLEPEDMAAVRLFAACADHCKSVRLLELSEADAAGRLVLLPCRAGDTVYEVRNNTDACTCCCHYSSWFGADSLCDSESVDEKHRDSPRFAVEPICEKQFMEIVEYEPDIETIFRSRKDFGKTVFLSRQEAEAALKLHEVKSEQEGLNEEAAAKTERPAD